MITNNFIFFTNNITNETVQILGSCLKMGKIKRILDLGAVLAVKELKSGQCMIYLASDFYKTHKQK